VGLPEEIAHRHGAFRRRRAAAAGLECMIVHQADYMF
jgi:hypothetical protein